MKKSINFLLAVQAIVLIATASLTLSSCVVIHPDDEADIYIEKKDKDSRTSSKKKDNTEEQTPAAETFTITCKNETSNVVANWFVKNDNIITLSKTGFTGAINAHGEDKIFDLPKGYYKIYFSFAGNYCPGGYQSDTIYLDKDVTYCLLSNNSSSPYIEECRSVK